jgi:2-oxoglutarate dehydrogenase E2 component (dihydrolipoamide succinyltransferase)
MFYSSDYLCSVQITNNVDMIEIKVPSPGESVTQVQLARWLVSDGDFVEKDQEIAEIDSDKATLSISAQESGQIKFMVQEGDTIEVETVIASIDTSVSETPEKRKKPDKAAKDVIPDKEPETVVEAEPKKSKSEKGEMTGSESGEGILNISPLAKKLMKKNNLSEKEFINFLKGLRIGKKDVEIYLSGRGRSVEGSGVYEHSKWGGTRDTEIKKMSTLRLKISERLVAVRNQTAMLTTFNEVNMTPVMNIRKKYKDKFQEKHGVSLGLMSFFTKAITEALHLIPDVNASLDGDNIIYHNYADIGIAVSSPRGLMVPVLRNAEQMSFAEIEQKIRDLAEKARTNKITIDEMAGGTFTITNGGVFGSMLSTPILNPPQSAILGMHNIIDRPVAVNGKVEIHPVMYVALSYDHRIVDGRESVTFLVRVKEMLENPERMIFGGEDPVLSLLNL